MSKRQQLAKYLDQFGGIRVLDWIWGKHRLTVLAYHRINDYTSPQFLGYVPNVSASPQMFKQQIAFVARHFNVIDLAALRSFVVNGTPLPPRPLLITFDDGYLDNYQHAFPILRRYGFPAVIFLATDSMEHPTVPLWWDACAIYFRDTSKTHANLPLLGQQEFASPARRKVVLDQLISRTKELPESEKHKTLNLVANSLGVTPTTDYAPFFVNWDQVRELVAGGIACQPHTMTHPIMTRITPDEAQDQLTGSKMRIEEETGQAVYAFAFPNGLPGDYDISTLRSLRELNYDLAFTLNPGPVRRQAVRRHPLQIGRIFLGYRDTLEIFKMKIMGAAAMVSRAPIIQG